MLRSTTYKFILLFFGISFCKAFIFSFEELTKNKLAPVFIKDFNEFQRYEIEKRASLVAPLTPQEALKVAMAKQQVDRYNTELHNMCIMSREGQKLWDDYQQALKESKERHKAQVKAIIQANKRRKELIKTSINVALISLIGLIVAGIVVAIVVAAFG